MGFKATIPTSRESKLERRKRRAVVSEKRLGLGNGERLGLREKGERARGLLGGPQEVIEEEEEEGEELRIGRGSFPRRKGTNKEVTALSKVGEEKVTVPTRNDLEKDLKAVDSDMGNVRVRRSLLNGQIRDVEKKIRELEEVRDGFRKGLLGLREEELELEDERAYLPLFISICSFGVLIGGKKSMTCSRRYSNYFSSTTSSIINRSFFFFFFEINDDKHDSSSTTFYIESELVVICPIE